MFNSQKPSVDSHFRKYSDPLAFLCCIFIITQIVFTHNDKVKTCLSELLANFVKY